MQRICMYIISYTVLGWGGFEYVHATDGEKTILLAAGYKYASVECRNDTWQEIPTLSENTLTNFHFIHQRINMNCPGIESDFLHWEADS
jgi:hypothetical protein